MKYVFLIFCWHVGSGGNACNNPVPEPNKEVCEFMGKNMIADAASIGDDGKDDGGRLEAYRCASYGKPDAPTIAPPKVKR